MTPAPGVIRRVIKSSTMEFTSSAVRGLIAALVPNPASSARRALSHAPSTAAVAKKALDSHPQLKGRLTVNRYQQNELGDEMAARVDKKSETGAEKSQLSKQDIRLLLVMCTELVNLCAKLTGRIDPTAAAMLGYVRDDIQSENRSELP